MLQRRFLAKRLAQDPIVGDFKISDEEIGESSTGVVRLATRESDGIKSAVKILYRKNNSSSFGSPSSSPTGPNISNFSSLSQRLKDEANREVDLLKKLQHENIIKLYEIVEEDSYVFIFMEYLDEGDLYNYIQKFGMMEEDKARVLFRQMLSALSHCHEKKVCHHDFKLENCVIDKDLNLRVIDFGYAFSYENKPEGELFHHFTGSPAYSALEILDRKPHNESIDIFSLGTCLYYMLSAEFPFCDENRTTYEQLCRNVRVGRVNFPEHFSGQVRDLLTGMLGSKTELRSSLDQIRNHPWLTGGQSMMDISL